ncbi:hypothetical protein BLNAU_9879 [Blattamonas nauphoetae]|uniref:Uncharacterized protein n=1 Tax=Blattamonas nauphoetae TaxID=2049346 RepID=A0ABQ9XUJ1_9EUKA|nr:hypothetical protein BLNAU_9879 [Blattamonas nauphoetae]
MVAATLSFLNTTLSFSSAEIRSHLVNSDLISNVLATIKPDTLPISGNEKIIDELIGIIAGVVHLALTDYREGLDITSAFDKFYRREMIFQKIVIPSSPFVTFLISNRNILNGDLSKSLMSLLGTLLEFSPFHHPTLDAAVFYCHIVNRTLSEQFLASLNGTL